MAELPSGLGPSGAPGGPEDFGQESSVKEFMPRTLSMEENINRQLDRISYLRSMGHPWGEAVYQLRDMIVGLEDDEFFDGIPEGVREDMKKMTKKQREKVLDKYKEQGWDGYPIRAYKASSGRIVYKPTSENLSAALRIVMRLLARQNIVWRSKRVSKLTEWKSGESNESPAED